ncbi:hypothetical protein JG687_00000613, partial [Phytophthora cactorum]
PYGVSSLDENSVRTKARTAAKSFIPTKLDKFAIRFYVVVGWVSFYVHSVWDNGSGNYTNTTPPSRYTSTFLELRTSLNRTLAHPDVNIERGSPSALWVAMMGPPDGPLSFTDRAKAYGFRYFLYEAPFGENSAHVY